MIYKVFGALIMGAALALVFLTFQDDIGLGFTKPKSEVCVQLTPAQQFNKLINDDFQKLLVDQQLPAEWNNIASVEVRMNSELAKALLGKSRPHIQRVKEGTAFLELEIVDLPDEENPGVIIQASLFDIKSKNKIFEIGRTYTMNDLNNPPSATPSAEDSKEAQGDIAPEDSQAPGTSLQPTVVEPAFDQPLAQPTAVPSPTASAAPVEPGTATVPSVNASGATPTPTASPTASATPTTTAPKK